MTKEIIDLLTILSSSNYISTYSGQNLSISEASIDLHKLMKSYQDERDKVLQSFDSFDIDDIEDPKFLRRLDRSKKKRYEYQNIFNLKVPFPLLEANPAHGEGRFQVDEQFADKIAHPIVAKWYDKYLDFGGKNCFLFKKDELFNSMFKLKKVGQYEIRINAMEKVIDEVSLEGSYTFYREFDSVPDACRYYMGQNGKDYNREKLKEQIGKYARISEKGDPILDWSVINARINSWWYHEENKYKRI
jgi:hypothetical protein